MSIEGDNAAPQYTAAATGGLYTPSESHPYTPVTLDNSGDNQARHNVINLERAQWSDYEKRFAPVEDELIGQIGDPQYYANQVQTATDDARSAYAKQPGIQERELSRYGVATPAQQANDQDVNAGLSAATAIAQAANQTRAGLKQRETQIMSGGLVPSGIQQPKQAS